MIREVAVTHAFRVPVGAQLYGGPRDGLTVGHAHVRIDEAGPRPLVVFLFTDGSEHRCNSADQVAWLHPAGRTANA